MPSEPLADAVRILRAGGLVAFPTETVYGLGADATNPVALRKIFAVKGRPADHPLILHIAREEELAKIARHVPEEVQSLARRFWPGPLTLVLEKADSVPKEVSGGLSTVAVRIPKHPLALALLQAFGRPIAAPSANRFGRVSPTSAEHVRNDLGSAVDLVLDGGPAEVGVESTIVNVTRRPFEILRLGGVSAEELEAALPGPWRSSLEGGGAPGRLPAHYAPNARVLLVDEAEVTTKAATLVSKGQRLAALVPHGVDTRPFAVQASLPRDPAGYAHALYAALRALDSQHPDVILVVLPEERGIGRAVADRIRRAAAAFSPGSVD